MEDRIRLKVLGLTYSQIQSGAYALILAQVDGPYRIPIVIGAAEAQSIAIKLEGLHPPRPLTHDLFDSFVHAFGIRLKEVFIHKFEQGIFYSEMTFTDGTREIVLDARTSDAIAIALRTKSPIYTTIEILYDNGFVMNEDGSATSRDGVEIKEVPPREPKLENYSIEELEKTLADLIDREEYEEAAKVQKILNEKRGNKA